MRLNLFIPPGVMPPATLRGMRPPFSLLLLCAALLLPVARAAPAESPPLCRVTVRSWPAPISPQRVLLISVRPDCPPDGYARVRLQSMLGGSLPDNPPGAYTIRPGQPLRRVALPWWHVAWLSASGKPYRVSETP